MLGRAAERAAHGGRVGGGREVGRHAARRQLNVTRLDPTVPGSTHPKLPTTALLAQDTLEREKGQRDAVSPVGKAGAGGTGRLATLNALLRSVATNTAATASATASGLPLRRASAAAALASATLRDLDDRVPILPLLLRDEATATPGAAAAAATTNAFGPRSAGGTTASRGAGRAILASASISASATTARYDRHGADDRVGGGGRGRPAGRRGGRAVTGRDGGTPTLPPPIVRSQLFGKISLSISNSGSISENFLTIRKTKIRDVVSNSGFSSNISDVVSILII